MKFTDCSLIESTDLSALYTSVQWTGYTDFPDKMSSMLKASLWWSSCWDADTLVGLIRVVGDGVSIVYVQDVLVNPKYQHQGIGKALFGRMLAEFSMIRQIVLITDDDPKTRGFYASVGMQSVEDTHGCAFVRYNFNQ